MKPRFRDIPQFTQRASYQIDVGWDYLEEQLNHYAKDYGLELDPPFQRAHVWTENQQRAYVEHVLMGGWASNLILFNCQTWNTRTKTEKPIVLVDGKQRLNAVRQFLSDKLAIFGGYVKSDYEDKPDLLTARFRFGINDLPTDKQVLQWYLELNSGGTPHAQKELDKVREMVEKIEKGEPNA